MPGLNFFFFIKELGGGDGEKEGAVLINAVSKENIASKRNQYLVSTVHSKSLKFTQLQ